MHLTPALLEEQEKKNFSALGATGHVDGSSPRFQGEVPAPTRLQRDTDRISFNSAGPSPNAVSLLIVEGHGAR
jgi:hypothetical protein